MNHRDLLNKYFNGTISDEELLELLNYLSEEGNAGHEELFREIWNSYQSKVYFDRSESQILLESLKQRIDTEESKDRRRRMYWVAAAAASVLVVAFALAITFAPFNGREHVASGYGETRHIILPDGSEVTLNANSSITYFDNWSDDENESNADFVRQVWLEGEAFFSVQRHDIPQRFVVFTDDLDVEVLGTTFNVNSRRDRTQVLLKSGLVKLNIKDSPVNEILMNPGDVVEYGRGSLPVKTHTSLDSEQSSWLNNVLTYDDTPLRQIGREIEDIYGYTVNISEEHTGEIVFTGTVPLDDLDQLLKLISRSCGVEVTRKNNVITIREPK